MRYLIIIILNVIWITGTAQSYFYNTQHFGLQSTLLGGAVTAGSSDLSMVYYNPAALRYAKNRGFDLAIFMPSYSTTNYGNFFKNGKDLRSTELSLNPSLITYKTTIKDFNIVFSILQKDIWDNEISYSEIKKSVLYDKNESFKYSYKGDEKWFGVGSHFSLTESISLGLSQFWTFHSTDYNYHISSEVFTNQGIQANFFNNNLDLRYRSLFGMVTKLGFSLDRPGDRIGVVVTTPYYSPARTSARFERNISSFDLDNFSLENIVDFNLKPNLKSGWHFDIGYAKVLRDSSELWINGSVHAGVGQHNVLSVERVQGDPLLFSRSIGTVANLSVGHARYLSPKIQLIGSLRTNFSAFENKPISEASEKLVILEQDRLHFALGCKVKHKNSSFVVGLDWGFSLASRVEQFDNFPNIELFNTNPAEYGHRSLTLLLTYEFFIDRVGEMIDQKKSSQGFRD